MYCTFTARHIDAQPVAYAADRTGTLVVWTMVYAHLLVCLRLPQVLAIRDWILGNNPTGLIHLLCHIMLLIPLVHINAYAQDILQHVGRHSLRLAVAFLGLPGMQ